MDDRFKELVSVAVPLDDEKQKKFEGRFSHYINTVNLYNEKEVRDESLKIVPKNVHKL